MPGADDIKHQQTLLETYRSTLAILLKQRASLGAAYTPPGTINGINEARSNITRIKAVLRTWGEDVEDDPNDEEAEPVPIAQKLAQSQPASSTTVNIYGPIHSGSTQIGGTQDIKEAKLVMGNNYDFSGANITGSNINVGSTLTNVTQNIGSIPNASTEDKQKLEQLVKQLQAELQKVPEAQADDAEKVANRTKAMVDEVNKTKPDKEFVEINGESLKKAATNIGAVLPAVLTIATQIATHITSMLK